MVASGCIPAHAAQFGIYESLKDKFECNNDEYNVLSNMIIGACATFGHDFFQTPCDVVKQRVQLCNNLTGTQVFRNIIADEGFRGLYRSFPITLFMNIPFLSIVVCINENLNTFIQP